MPSDKSKDWPLQVWPAANKYHYQSPSHKITPVTNARKTRASKCQLCCGVDLHEQQFLAM